MSLDLDEQLAVPRPHADHDVMPATREFVALRRVFDAIHKTMTGLYRWCNLPSSIRVPSSYSAILRSACYLLVWGDQSRHVTETLCPSHGSPTTLPPSTFQSRSLLSTF